MGEDNSAALAPIQEPTSIKVHTLEDIQRLGKLFVASNMFKGDKNADPIQKIAEASVKIIAANEFGIGAFAAMQGLNIFDGRVEMGGNLIASRIRQSGQYDYEVRDWSKRGCTIQMYQLINGRRQALEAVRFDEVDAEEAELIDPTCKLDDETGRIKHNVQKSTRKSKYGDGTYTVETCGCKDNWRKYRKAMYFNRAISAAARTHAPDVFGGSPVYTPGEIERPPVEPAPEPAPPKKIKNEAVDKPADDAAQATKPGVATPEQRRLIGELLAEGEVYDTEERLSLVIAIIDREIGSATDMTADEADRVIARLQSDIDERDAARAKKPEEQVDVNLDDPAAEQANVDTPAAAAGDDAADVLAVMASDGDKSFPTLEVKTAPSDLMLVPDIDVATSEAKSFRATDEEKTSIKATVRKLGMTSKGEGLYLGHVTGGKSFYASFETADWYRVKVFTDLIVAGKEPLDEAWMPKAKGKAAKEVA